MPCGRPPAWAATSPTYCTCLEKAILFCLDETEVRRIIRTYPIQRYASNTLKNVEELLLELKRTRKRGYAADNEEIEVGLRCAGAPIRDYTSRLKGTIPVACRNGGRLGSVNAPGSQVGENTVALVFLFDE